jgi:hypothetical protein
VELPATGYSMFPTLLSGDKVVVRQLLKAELPERGRVVVFVDDSTPAQTAFAKAIAVNGRNGITAQSEVHVAQGGEPPSILVMHRLVEVKKDDSGNLLFITRGDSMMEPDEPWTQQQLVGVAVSYKQGKKEYPVKSFVPKGRRYKYNRRLLWMYSKVMRLTRILGK